MERHKELILECITIMDGTLRLIKNIDFNINGDALINELSFILLDIFKIGNMSKFRLYDNDNNWINLYFLNRLKLIKDIDQLYNKLNLKVILSIKIIKISLISRRACNIKKSISSYFLVDYDLLLYRMGVRFIKRNCPKKHTVRMREKLK
uniref:Uncharacterized protein n=1 Tax=Amorphochlora amoebiformis TaxID=1561963 RepID=A0A0H5BR19_9EUKA|nr:hypothetical protein [Amorphochlora amoebiformis]